MNIQTELKGSKLFFDLMTLFFVWLGVIFSAFMTFGIATPKQNEISVYFLFAFTLAFLTKVIMWVCLLVLAGIRYARKNWKTMTVTQKIFWKYLVKEKIKAIVVVSAIVALLAGLCVWFSLWRTQFDWWGVIAILVVFVLCVPVAFLGREIINYQRKEAKASEE